MLRQNKNVFAKAIINDQPCAKATIKGRPKNPRLHGAVYFYKIYDGTLVVAEIYGIPQRDDNGKPSPGFYGFHIHEGANCTGDESDPFKNAGGHYNPTKQEHPLHSGDLPVLLSNKGYSYMMVYTDRFSPSQIIGRTVIVHMMADDFHSQPAGDSGMKIGCGQIKKYK